MATAKSNLDRYFSVVGLVERFDETLILLQKAFSWQPPLYIKQNVTSEAEKKHAEISKATVEKIKQYNAMDVELYDYAVQRFEEQLAAIDDLEQLLNRQRFVNMLYQPIGRSYNFARSLMLKS